jgi:hypothetical protein
LRLPVAEPAFDRYAVAELLQESGLHLTDDPEPHVELRCRAPWVQDRGWLNFIGNWHYWSQPPNDHADWVRAIAPDSAGKLEIWMDGLTIGQNYLVSIKVQPVEKGSMRGLSGGPVPGMLHRYEQGPQSGWADDDLRDRARSIRRRLGMARGRVITACPRA